MKDKTYSQEKNNIAIINIFFTVFLLFLIASSSMPAHLEGLARIITTNSYISLMLFFVFINLVIYIIMFPLNFYSSYTIEHRYSLSNQSLKSWLSKELKKNILGFIISIPLVISLYAFLRYFPFLWWVFVSLLWLAVSILIAKLFPVIILPIFYKYSDIKNPSLKDKLNSLTTKVGFKAKGVYEIDFSKETKKANAAVIGLGREKRIILCDTLLKNFKDEEIISVMGHELGHHRLKHSLRLIIFGGMATILTFFLINTILIKLRFFLDYKNIYDFKVLVYIYLFYSFINVVLLPIQNAYSRKLEKDADLFTLELTKDKDAFVSTMKKLAEINLADASPSKFHEIMLYSHPPISRRIKLGESFKIKE
ncbi:MAG: M48 family metallopeptidase [Candidatus Omnitrophota bacterium]